MNLIFKKKSYKFKLSTKVKNSKTTYLTKSGWIIKLKSNDKKIGFGEVSPLLEKDLKKCAKQLNMIPEYIEEFNLSEQINIFHPCIQSAIKDSKFVAIKFQTLNRVGLITGLIFNYLLNKWN